MKAHLRDSDLPIKEGTTVIANCGAEIPQTRFVFFWDASEKLEFSWSSFRGCCRKCMDGPVNHRYVYGCVPGQESLVRVEGEL